MQAFTHIRRFAPLFTLTVLMLAGAGVAAAADQWIHVRVENPQQEETVTVNLPLSLVGAAAALIPEEAQREGHIVVDDLDMDWQDLKTFWQEVKDAPEATFVTVESRDETVKVRKEGAYLLIRTTERSEDGADVDAKLPLTVVDALLSGPEGTLNFEAALTELAAHGPGELVSVRDGEETVRVWIDDQNEVAD